LTDPPIKVQIDFEFVDYSEKDQPTDWAAFSHSSSWDDISQGIKGVFHKWLIQSLTKIASEDFILRKVHKRTGKITDKVERDSMLSFAVSSKEGGGLRTKYEPVLDEKGQPLVIDGLPVLKELPPGNYEKDISKIFQAIFDKRIDRASLSKALSKTWSFTGLLELINLVLPQEEKESVLDSFVDKLFARGAQGLYKGDPQRDLTEKNVALNYALKVLGVTPPTNLEQMRQEYVKNYRVATEGPVGLDNPIDEAEGDAAPVKAQFRKGMPHLHDLKPLDFLDLLDEIHDGNGRFKLENIPLNVKVDGFGGRFGKNAEGKPFMGTSRTEPRYQAGFVAYHQQKGTTDPEVLGRAQLFDNLFEEMMKAIKLVDSKLGSKFLVNKQVTCEVLFLPFATETPEGKLKFVGIQYDKLPEGIQLALVPFRVVESDTGEDLPNSNEFIKELLSVGSAGSVMFIDNSLTQKEGLDVTALVPPLENLEQFKAMLADKSPGSLQRKRDVAAALDPVKVALEQAIIKDPNILGKDLLGKDYEGIVINSRLGPIKVTSQEQRDVISAKQDAKKNAWTERPRENGNKTAVVAVGSFIGHKGHEELFNYTINKAKEVGGDPYLFIGNAEGKDDPIPPAVKVQTWHKLYPEYAKNISTVQAGGVLIQKIKHELINPLPGKPPRYDNIIIMVGEDRAGMNMPAALMKAVNKFQGYEHVKVSLDVTPRGTGISGTSLRNSLKNDSPEKALAVWSNAFDVNKLGVDWIKHLMDITKKGMGIQQPVVQKPAPVVAERLFNTLIRPNIIETARKSAAVKLSNAWDQQQQKSAASRERAEKAKAEFEKEWKAKQEKEKGVAEAFIRDGADWGDALRELNVFNDVFLSPDIQDTHEYTRDPEWQELAKMIRNSAKVQEIYGQLKKFANLGVKLTSPEVERLDSLVWDGGGDMDIDRLKDLYAHQLGAVEALLKTQAQNKTKSGQTIHEQGVAEGAPIVVMPSPERLKKAEPTKVRYQGDIVPPTKPPSTEKRGVKGRPGQRSMPKHNESVAVEPDPTGYQKDLLTSPENSLVIDTPGDLDWYKLGQHYPTLGQDDPHEYGQSDSDMVIVPYSKQELAGLKQKLDRLKMRYKDIGGGHEQPEIHDKVEEKIKGADGKACWDDYRYNGTKDGKDSCVKVSEDVQNIMDVLINKIITNEAIQNNKRTS
jgi:hypothetical protein